MSEINTEKTTIPSAQKKITLGEVIFDSEFDSGNLSDVIQTGETTYDVYILGDYIPEKTYRVYHFWYYFSMTGVKQGKLISFTFKNIGNQEHLFSFGFRPVVRVGTKPWKRISGKFECLKKEKQHFAIKFEHLFDYPSAETTYFALTFPYSYVECQNSLDEYERIFANHPMLYFHREQIAVSVEKRRLDLLTISAKNGKLPEREPEIPGLNLKTAFRPYKFDKPTIFITARVHPGETQGSHMLNGFLSFLFCSQPGAPPSHKLISNLLLKKFVFKIIPMLNPDGVSWGHFRLDSLGQNLNRYYLNPSEEFQPTIFAAKLAVLQQHSLGNLKFFIDLHGHLNKLGTFLYGNTLKGSDQVENMLFARLLSLNSLSFDYFDCNFNESIMNVKDRLDGLSREGCSRVAIYKETQLVNCYTIEASFHGSKRLNVLPLKQNKIRNSIESETAITNLHSKFYEEGEVIYTPEIYEDFGRALCFSLLDFWDENPISRVPNSVYKSVDGIRKDLNVHLEENSGLPKVIKNRYSNFTKNKMDIFQKVKSKKECNKHWDYIKTRSNTQDERNVKFNPLTTKYTKKGIVTRHAISKREEEKTIFPPIETTGSRHHKLEKKYLSTKAILLKPELIMGKNSRFPNKLNNQQRSETKLQ